MKLEINVDETQFKDILDKELKEMPKEVIQDVIVKSIQGYFEQNNYENVQRLFVQTTETRWDTKKTSTDFLNGLVKDCDYSALQDVVDKAIEDVKENHRSIVCDLISKIITNGLFTDYNFRSALDNAVRDVLCSMNRN
jgi:hypothetical protein